MTQMSSDPMRASNTFTAALAQTLKWEGGYSNHPADPGGATNHGITQRTYDAWRTRKGRAKLDVRDITEPEVRAIYLEDYWLPAGCASLSPALALCVFDAAVNSGVGPALKWLAGASGWVDVNAARLEFLASLSSWASFGKGWVRRVADLSRAAAQLEWGGTSPPAGDRLLIVMDRSNREAYRAPLLRGDSVLLRATSDRVYVRVDASE